MTIVARVGRPLTRILAAAAIAVAVGTGSACAPSTGSAPSTAPTAPASTNTPATPEASPSETPATPAAVDTVPAATESAPPGDIPDNLAFITYRNDAGRYSFTHPEGWNESVSGTRARFADKLNSVTYDSAVTTLQDARPADLQNAEVVRLKAAVPAFELRDVKATRLPAGPAVHLTYRRNSEPDPVTGKVYRDEVEEYLVVARGRLVRLELSGPVGADNVDAYRTMSQSLRVL